MSYYETERDNRIICALRDIAKSLKSKNEFIEIKTKDERRRLINVNFIEEVCEKADGGCSIYMAFNSPMAYEQDFFEVDMSFDEIIDLIKRR